MERERDQLRRSIGLAGLIALVSITSRKGRTMRNFSSAVLAGVAVLAVAGTAIAAGRNLHTMTVDLPDGSVAKVEYQGHVAPRVTIAPAREFAPIGFLGALDIPSIATFERIQADLDQQAESMFREASALASEPVTTIGQLDPVALGKLPKGTVSYSFVSTSNGRDICNRSLQVTSFGPDRPPKVVSNMSGDCNTMKRMPAPAGLDAPDVSHPLDMAHSTAEIAAPRDPRASTA
jgi:hypothetical protein